MNWRRVALVSALVVGAGGLLFTASLTSAAPKRAKGISFVKDIAPIIQANCIACHSSDKNQGGLVMETYEAMMKGGKSGAAIVPGKSRESLLVKMLEGTAKPRMPKDLDPLPKKQFDLLRRWIDQGAKSDAKADFVIKPAAPPLPDIPARKEIVVISLSSAPPSERAEGQPPLEALVEFGPPAPVAALAFSPDGKLLAVGGYKVVQLWDMENGKLSFVLSGHTGMVNALAFSNDGKTLAAAGGIPHGGGEIKIWDIASRQCLQTLGEHKDTVYAVALSADGKWLASGGADGLVHIWDLSSGKVVHTIKEHAGWIYGLAFSPDCKFLATGSADKTVRVFNVGGNWERVGNFEHPEDVWAVAFSPDGNQIAIAVGGPSDKTVRVRNRSNGQVVGVYVGQREPVLDVAWSADGKLLASASADRAVFLFDIGKGNPRATLTGHTDWVYSVAISPDGRLVASGSGDGTVKIWNTADGKLLATLFSLTPDAKQWLVLTSVGYYAISPEASANAFRWRRGGKEIPADKIQILLCRPEMVGRILKGEKVEPPKLAGE